MLIELLPQSAQNAVRFGNVLDRFVVLSWGRFFFWRLEAHGITLGTSYPLATSLKTGNPDVFLEFAPVLRVSPGRVPATGGTQIGANLVARSEFSVILLLISASKSGRRNGFSSPLSSRPSNSSKRTCAPAAKASRMLFVRTIR